MPANGAPYSQAQLDAAAREKGFPSYAAWAAWDQKYRQPIREEVAPAAPTNWLQNLVAKIPWHPSFTLDFANKKIEKATGARK